ncbi:Beta-galactosidase [Proteiniphilum saccharofermentans]|jgi:beta-galactosidase|uniref:Beta-galactosidase n=1 Tax=Proteiniphilum saccharofermentans TaxID=1642647 RepID=A0A1R3TCY3_9BACT|nr:MULTISPECIES: glycoside hydrolase family 2 [Proteiniphilum]RNC66753.1 glycoside hydrolase family 2 [Proteiniphilum sp. X52]SCD21474.1 Beta-galactosidase [Proteiniphilum saccharofermentans]SDZ83918.1 beta-galactosidase [Porphyromonadaceae bacterium KH3R12]SFS71425.1 beta-galactosidase [Porphyromonadaceae bacterium NLAE-zl-C104]
MRKNQTLLCIAILFFGIQPGILANNPETSVAGFFDLEKSGRIIYNFNPGWRYHKGDVDNGESPRLDDSSWRVVSIPHTVELMPAEASGNRNYQGPAWYRKHFVVDQSLTNRDVSLYFEAVMGKSIVYINGRKVKEHIGGYLPFTVSLTDAGVQAGDTCLVAVFADNSDDKGYPPGKPQYTLDFAYHGGIYRDVWMMAKAKVAITDAVEANKVAGGGVFVHYDNISEKSADIFVDTDIRNRDTRSRSVVLLTELCDSEGNVLRSDRKQVRLGPGESKAVKQKMTVENPDLWSPRSPYLYRINSRVLDGNTPLDGGTTRIGIRKAEFRGKDGFYLNGKPYGQLIGANRHQDFAYVGNAVPNSQQWRDAKKLRDAGCEIIRAAHYPQDPAFMDACDELGLFVIVATPGWQYWNKDSEFGRLAQENNRQMIRRDRNHPSVLVWEPILNETRFPLDFSLEALKITKEEYPYPGAPVAAGDLHSEGIADHYDLVYGWPTDEGKVKQSIFTREFGENVDDWYAHNNNNRASRSWGEHPQLVQALSLAQSYGDMFNTTGQFIGGAHWHPFDHQRGYHPDPYFGGIFDAFRQPKYAFQLFKSQVDPEISHPVAETGPMVFIAHEITPFSGSDVVVFSNCDSVRLIVYETDTIVQKVENGVNGIPYVPVVFKDVFDFWEMREYTYVQKNWQKIRFVAEGIIDGKVVATTTKMPSRRSTKLRLYVDHEGTSLVADGSDFVTVVAEVTDDNGNVKRLAKENILFSVEGEGTIIGDAHIGANPRAVEFGSAPVLIRSTKTPGKITVKARVLFEGAHAPTPAEIEIESVAPVREMNYLEEDDDYSGGPGFFDVKRPVEEPMSEEQIRKALDEVERQQTDFGEKHQKK